MKYLALFYAEALSKHCLEGAARAVYDEEWGSLRPHLGRLIGPPRDGFCGICIRYREPCTINITPQEQREVYERHGGL